MSHNESGILHLQQKHLRNYRFMERCRETHDEMAEREKNVPGAKTESRLDLPARTLRPPILKSLKC